MCEYFNLKFGLQDSKFPWKSTGIYKFLSVRNGEMISNFSAVKTFKIYYFIMEISSQFGIEYSGINIV